MTPRIGSVCSGYGGLEMGLLSVIGGSVAWHAELDPNPSKVLTARFPGVPNLGDITEVDWTSVEPVDVFCAGYPCQPDSLAGKGLSEDDHRWIWPAIARAIGVLRPRHVFLENVPGHFVRGFRTVLGSLTSLGYDAQWTLVRAADVGAPHRRERLFALAADASDGPGEPQRTRSQSRGRGEVLVADANGRGLRQQPVRELGQRRAAIANTDGPIRAATNAEGDGRHEGRPQSAGQLRRPDAAECSPAVADAGSGRREGRQERDSEPIRPELDRSPRDDAGRLAADAWGAWAPAIWRWERASGRSAPEPTVPAHRGDGRRLSPRFVEWLMGLPDGWVTDILPRNPALTCLGNGVVPQQAALALRLLLPICEVAA